MNSLIQSPRNVLLSLSLLNASLKKKIEQVEWQSYFDETTP